MSYNLSLTEAVGILKNKGYQVEVFSQGKEVEFCLVDNREWDPTEVKREAACIKFEQDTNRQVTVEELVAAEEPVETGPNFGTLDQLLAVVAYGTEQTGSAVAESIANAGCALSLLVEASNRCDKAESCDACMYATMCANATAPDLSPTPDPFLDALEAPMLPEHRALLENATDRTAAGLPLDPGQFHGHEGAEREHLETQARVKAIVKEEIAKAKAQPRCTPFASFVWEGQRKLRALQTGRANEILALKARMKEALDAATFNKTYATLRVVWR